MISKYKVLTANGQEVPLTIKQFAGGEWDVRITKTHDAVMSSYLIIRADIRDGSIMTLALITDAVRQAFPRHILTLTMPYLPYARQDRRMVDGDAFSLKVFANFINSLKFKEVCIANCHSDVGLALIDNVKNFPITIPSHLVDCVDALVAPDAGALKKTISAANEYGISNVIRVDKCRDVATGDILSTTLMGDVSGKDLLVLDDICDGGRTFIELAKTLKDNWAGNLYLHVTHGIFSFNAKERLLAAGYETITATYDWTEEA